MTYQVPKQEEVKSILDLLFNQIEISGLPAEFDPAGIDWIYGVFIDDTDTPVAIIECERKLGIFLGAAMTMVPPAAAQESVDSGDLSAMVQDSINEVMNIMSRLFMSSDTSHLRFGHLEAEAALAVETKNLVAGFDKKTAYTINLKNYGEGALIFLTS